MEELAAAARNAAEQRRAFDGLRVVYEKEMLMKAELVGFTTARMDEMQAGPVDVRYLRPKEQQDDHTDAEDDRASDVEFVGSSEDAHYKKANEEAAKEEEEEEEEKEEEKEEEQEEEEEEPDDDDASMDSAEELQAALDAFEEADLAELADVAPEIHRALEAGDRHPWQVRPGHHSGAVDWKTGKRAGPATDLTPWERQYLKHEAVTAARAGIKGSQRGPVPVNLAKPGFHRGQRWRSGKNGGRQGWGNRGGSTEKQRRYYMKIRSGAAFRQTLGKAHPHYGGGGSGGAASSSGK